VKEIGREGANEVLHVLEKTNLKQNNPLLPQKHPYM
jgi:hypothetical protein